jgi:gluconolactonase
MKNIAISLFVLMLFFKAFAQETKPGTGTIDFVSDELPRLINKDAKVDSKTIYITASNYLLRVKMR